MERAFESFVYVLGDIKLVFILFLVRHALCGFHLSKIKLDIKGELGQTIFEAR